MELNRKMMTAPINDKIFIGRLGLYLPSNLFKIMKVSAALITNLFLLMRIRVAA